MPEQEVMSETAEETGEEQVLMSVPGKEVATFILVSMAKVSLLAWLAWALPVCLAGTCLRCWPNAAEYFSYDAHLLIQDADTSEKLEIMFLGNSEDQPYYGGNYLEEERMELEAGNLFVRLENLIKKNGRDHDLFIKEAEQEKKHFEHKLEEASDAFYKEICSLSCAKSRYKPYKVAQCGSCQVFTAPCLAPSVCAGPNVVAAVLVTLLFVGLGIGAGLYYRHKKKTEAEYQEEARKKEKESSSESTDTSEWSDYSPMSVSKYYNMQQSPIYEEVPASPNIYDEMERTPRHYDEVPPTSHYENISSVPEFPIPSPPSLPSPPNFPAHNIPSPPSPPPSD